MNSYRETRLTRVGAALRTAAPGRTAPRLRPALIAVALAAAFASCAPPGTITRTPEPEPEPEPRGPVTRTVDGFRLQIGMMNDRSEADATVEDAAAWYRNLPTSSRPPYLGNGDLDVHIAWRAPYYRVQIGSFATRDEAERALDAVKRRYPDAFPVPGTVIVTR